MAECDGCGYDLSGTSSRTCPECGRNTLIPVTPSRLGQKLPWIAGTVLLAYTMGIGTVLALDMMVGVGYGVCFIPTAFTSIAGLVIAMIFSYKTRAGCRQRTAAAWAVIVITIGNCCPVLIWSAINV